MDAYRTVRHRLINCMNEEIERCLLSDLCQVVVAKNYTLPVFPTGQIKSALYVPNKYELGKRLAVFIKEQKDSGYYLVSELRGNLIYCSFILNSGMGMLYMQDRGDVTNTRGTVSKKKLENVLINTIPDKYKRACNVLELIINRVSDFEVEDSVSDAHDAMVSFLYNMRSYIALEIYMNPIFVDRQVSVLEPWTRFVETKMGEYKINIVDNVFISFYKSVADPDNDIMDAMKKAKMFVWQLVDSIKSGKK